MLPITHGVFLEQLVLACAVRAGFVGDRESY